VLSCLLLKYECRILKQECNNFVGLVPALYAFLSGTLLLSCSVSNFSQLERNGNAGCCMTFLFVVILCLPWNDSHAFTCDHTDLNRGVVMNKI
jgi:hypothetical protein